MPNGATDGGRGGDAKPSERHFSKALLKYLSGLIIVSTVIIAALFVAWPHTEKEPVLRGIFEVKLYARTLGFLIASVAAAALITFFTQILAEHDGKNWYRRTFVILTFVFPIILSLAAAWPFIKHAWKTVIN